MQPTEVSPASGAEQLLSRRRSREAIARLLGLVEPAVAEPPPTNAPSSRAEPLNAMAQILGLVEPARAQPSPADAPSSNEEQVDESTELTPTQLIELLQLVRRATRRDDEVGPGLPLEPTVVDLPKEELLVVAAPAAPDEECPICLAPLDDECVKTPCQHHFHADCLEDYFVRTREPGKRASCPLCRGPVHAPLPVEATASSGLPIEVVQVPAAGGRCHFDREYTFQSLGGFASPGTLYVLTCNEDRKMPATEIMWTLRTTVAVTVHVNFRSDRHAFQPEGVQQWLAQDGWRRNHEIRSTVSSGYPNGPYSGPVFSRSFEAGSSIQLMGSNCWEGTYFVFIELATSQRPKSRPGAKRSTSKRRPGRLSHSGSGPAQPNEQA